MKGLFNMISAQTVGCAGCGKQIRLWLTPGTEPEGVRVNGENYCWACFESLFSEKGK